MKGRRLQPFALTFSVLLIMLILAQVKASAGWVRIYPGEEMDVLTPSSVVQTIDGGYATTISAVVRRVDNVGWVGHWTESYEIQILKTGPNGAVQWKRGYPTVEDLNHFTPTINTYTEDPFIVQTADQGYAIAGSYSSVSWLFKVDSQGSVVWSRTYTPDETPGNLHIYSMIQTRDGGFALAGTLFSYDGGDDYWLIKTNALGVAQWSKTYNSGTYTDSYGNVNPRADEAKCVIQTSDGGYALVGSASLFNAGTSSVTYSAWIVKTDAQGTQSWNQGYDLLNLFGYKSALIQTSDSGYAVAGNQNNDFCLFKVGSTGQLQWSRIYGDPQTDTPCALVQLEDDGYAVAGTWTPTNTTLTRPTLGLIRTDSSGQVIWTRTYNANENLTAVQNDEAKAMIRTSDGSYALVGSTFSDTGYHKDVFFVKTETLEQAPEITPVPTPASTGQSATQTPTQTSQPSSSPSQPAQTQSPNSSPSNETPNNGILPISHQEQTFLIAGAIVVAVIVGTVLIRTRMKRKGSVETNQV